MTGPVTYELADGVATVTVDDGKVNALSTGTLAAIAEAVERAAVDDAVLLLRGRPGIFSAGFDLRLLQDPGADSADVLAMLRGGFGLAASLLAFPGPVLIACTGHAIAMGSFLLLAADLRIAASGPFRIVANEVAIGLTFPLAAVELCHARLAPTHLQRSVLLSESYTPDAAVAAGFVDQAVDAASLDEVAGAAAAAAAALDRRAYAASKERLRGALVAAVRNAIVTEFGA